ncbi:cyclin-dependent kinase inhibitor 1C [Malaya genurostris]|uniref:cyclin-dependent kinase inhibitor 1C n=1 Tax=Malaya genurostris TaxID=325434 RepID=UPI0026F3F6CB|nr:cyclin-dependent kinase inhibitor 1C [Malaya genurostris]
MSAEVIIPMAGGSGIISRYRTSEYFGRRPAFTTRSPSVVRVKRDLFGPVDKEETNKIFKRELEVQNELSCQKWGFNFRTGQPLAKHDRFQWERVEDTSAPACFTGTTLIRAAHVVPNTTPTTSENLLDQRAERENILTFSTVTSSDSPTGSDSETDGCETIRTYPLVLRSDMITTFNATSTATITTTINTRTSSSSSRSTMAQRQKRMTDFLKERKRPSTGSAKDSLAKKVRLMVSPAVNNTPESQSSPASQ